MKYCFFVFDFFFIFGCLKVFFNFVFTFLIPVLGEMAMESLNSAVSGHVDSQSQKCSGSQCYMYFYQINFFSRFILLLRFTNVFAKSKFLTFRRRYNIKAGWFIIFQRHILRPVQTLATTRNIVGPNNVVSCSEMLADVCKRSQQVTTYWVFR